MEELFKNLNQMKNDVRCYPSRFNFIYFWRSDSPFSQWFISEFIFDGVEYNCMEKYMMAEKARLFGNKETEQLILKEQRPYKIKEYGRLVKNFNEKVWNENKYEIVVQGNLEKFQQNPELMFLLTDCPDNTIFVEASPYDGVWGIKMCEDEAKKVLPTAWRGENLLGFVLTEVRKQLKTYNKQLH